MGSRCVDPLFHGFGLRRSGMIYAGVNPIGLANMSTRQADPDVFEYARNSIQQAKR